MGFGRDGGVLQAPPLEMQQISPIFFLGRALGGLETCFALAG